jgi:hypothetical protein
MAATSANTPTTIPTIAPGERDLDPPPFDFCEVVELTGVDVLVVVPVPSIETSEVEVDEATVRVFKAEEVAVAKYADFKLRASAVDVPLYGFAKFVSQRFTTLGPRAVQISYSALQHHSG